MKSIIKTVELWLCSNKLFVFLFSEMLYTLSRLQSSGQFHRMENRTIPRRVMNATFDGENMSRRSKYIRDDVLRKNSNQLTEIKNIKLHNKGRRTYVTMQLGWTQTN